MEVKSSADLLTVHKDMDNSDNLYDQCNLLKAVQISVGSQTCRWWSGAGNLLTTQVLNNGANASKLTSKPCMIYSNTLFS